MLFMVVVYTFTGDVRLGQAQLQYCAVQHQRLFNYSDSLISQEVLSQIQNLQDLQHWL